MVRSAFYLVYGHWLEARLLDEVLNEIPKSNRRHGKKCMDIPGHQAYSSFGQNSNHQQHGFPFWIDMVKKSIDHDDDLDSNFLNVAEILRVLISCVKQASSK